MHHTTLFRNCNDRDGLCMMSSSRWLGWYPSTRTRSASIAIASPLPVSSSFSEFIKIPKRSVFFVFIYKHVKLFQYKISDRQRRQRRFESREDSYRLRAGDYIIDPALNDPKLHLVENIKMAALQ